MKSLKRPLNVELYEEKFGDAPVHLVRHTFRRYSCTGVRGLSVSMADLSKAPGRSKARLSITMELAVGECMFSTYIGVRVRDCGWSAKHYY